MKDVGRPSSWDYAAASIAVVTVTAVSLAAMGRVPICECGYVRLWHGTVLSSENSQHLSDWYTFSHVIHGFGFYALLWMAGRRWPAGLRLVLALAVEGAWEIFENTDFVIDRYRAETISLDYYGDSVLNSISDLTAMALGFGLAWRLPARAIVGLTVLMEVGVAYVIRDNLLLNIIMLVHPVDWIRIWQSGISP